MPTATVVVLNYNYGRFLEDCLRSLEEQTHPIRAIVIDDCSTDGSQTILRDWAESTAVDVELVLKPINRGPAHSYNLALEMLEAVPSEFVSFVDSDDFLHPEKTARQVETFSKVREDVVVVYSDATRLYNDGTSEFQPAQLPPSTTQALLARGSFFALHAGLIRGTALRQIAVFDESIRVCDLHLWLQLSRLGAFHHEAFDAATVRVHGASFSNANLAADRLRLVAANVVRHADRAPARQRGRVLLKAVSRSPERVPASVYWQYLAATRDPLTLVHAGRLLLPRGVVGPAHTLWRRLRTTTQRRRDTGVDA